MYMIMMLRFLDRNLVVSEPFLQSLIGERIRNIRIMFHWTRMILNQRKTAVGKTNNKNTFKRKTRFDFLVVCRPTA